MGTKLFVGGLAWATDGAGLRKAFEKFGAVEDSVVITDRETGRSRGFGFVTMVDDAAAEAAIAGMDGSSVDGRNVRVNKAEERSRGPGGGPRGPRRDGPRPPGRDGGRGPGRPSGPPRGPRRDAGGPARGGPPRGGRGGWASPAPPDDGAESWSDDDGSRRSKRSRKFDSGSAKKEERPGQDTWTDRGSRGGGGGRSRRRSWDDWDDE